MKFVYVGFHLTSELEMFCLSTKNRLPKVVALKAAGELSIGVGVDGKRAVKALDTTLGPYFSCVATTKDVIVVSSTNFKERNHYILLSLDLKVLHVLRVDVVPNPGYIYDPFILQISMFEKYGHTVVIGSSSMQFFDVMIVRGRKLVGTDLRHSVDQSGEWIYHLVLNRDMVVVMGYFVDTRILKLT